MFVSFRQKEESFEERRVQDYLHAYRTTGRPPAPCPQVPIDPQARAALRLPPLFEPHVEAITNLSGRGSPTASGSPEPPLDVQSIVAQPEYKQFSFEEMRWLAYRSGHKYATIPLPRPPTSTPSMNGGGDIFQSICAFPQYDKHSFEELRVAYLRSGRELTSAEIIAQNAVLKLTVP
ncbi:hypothetical protein A0H81_10149 [Grifola frondosa]|uniref:Uncharacterized protein n=1 Tax=Grifola frondosa TaxID=5627 RepID=A0A1C7M0K3_GRIFR|nr:hypothetical protein A0H81_10149 [Grifola frondosa]